MRVLLIEDEPALQAQISAHLQGEGHRVDVSGEGEEGLYFAEEYPLDAAIVDLGLPGMSGLEVIRTLRAQGKTLPILILTARGRWQDKVEGLDAGADDYLVKPFHMEELMARLKALVRRAAGAAQTVLECGPLSMDLNAQQVRLHGEPVSLTAYEYRLLEYLVSHRDQVVPKQTLADYLYAHDDERDSNVIEVLIGRLRRKLSPDDGNRAIATLRGRGYRFTLGDAAQSAAGDKPGA